MAQKHIKQHIMQRGDTLWEVNGDSEGCGISEGEI